MEERGRAGAKRRGTRRGARRGARRAAAAVILLGAVALRGIAANGRVARPLGGHDEFLVSEKDCENDQYC